MLAQTHILRATARGAPRLHTTSAGVGGSRLFSSSSAVRNQPNPHQEVIGLLNRAQTTQDASAAASASTVRTNVKPLHPTFVFPQDFNMKARAVPDLPPKKIPQLGPRRAEAKRKDVFLQQNIDPLDEAMNSFIMSAFVTDMGKIKGRAETELTWRSQRRMGKAIRRAKNMGIIPILSRRPLKGN